jgi:hypothetical protein
MKDLKGSGLPVGSYFQPVSVVESWVEVALESEPEDEVVAPGFC